MNKEIINRYLQHRCLPEERAAVEQWMDTEGAQWYDNFFDAHIHHHNLPASATEDDAVFMQVLQVIRERRNIHRYGEPVKVVPLRKTPFLRHSWAAAACIVILAGIGWLGLRQVKNYNSNRMEKPAWTEVTNPNQATKQVLLPDNSRVVLNKGSVLRYRQEYGQKERTVELSGEAFFEVTHNNEKPFIVKAGEASTIVYGTVFNVQAYSQEGQIAISLQRGKIGVRYTGKKAAIAEKVLVPGELYQYNKSTGETLLNNIPPEQVGSWKSGGLSFYSTPLRDVFIQLERRFGVHFKAEENLLTGNTFTAYFPDASLEQVLEHLQFTSGLQFERQGSVIYVK